MSDDASAHRQDLKQFNSVEDYPMVDVTMLERYVAHHGRARHENGFIETLADEANFIAGAGTVIFALGLEKYLPASWVWKLLGGESPCDIDYKE